VAPNAADLHVLPTKKFLHVGKFATDTEPNTVLNYVSTKLKVNASSLTVVKLVKKDVCLVISLFVLFSMVVAITTTESCEQGRSTADNR